MIMKGWNLIGNRRRHKHGLISTPLEGFRQEQDISFKTKCHKITKKRIYYMQK
jgi:hypothetical protein